MEDRREETSTRLLVEEIAYQQWHRMLFARFLAENGLLMHPTGVPVTLQELRIESYFPSDAATRALCESWRNE